MCTVNAFCSVSWSSWSAPFSRTCQDKIYATKKTGSSTPASMMVLSMCLHGPKRHCKVHGAVLTETSFDRSKHLNMPSVTKLLQSGPVRRDTNVKRLSHDPALSEPCASTACAGLLTNTDGNQRSICVLTRQEYPNHDTIMVGSRKTSLHFWDSYLRTHQVPEPKGEVNHASSALPTDDDRPGPPGWPLARSSWITKTFQVLIQAAARAASPRGFASGRHMQRLNFAFYGFASGQQFS